MLYKQPIKGFAKQLTVENGHGFLKCTGIGFGYSPTSCSSPSFLLPLVTTILLSNTVQLIAI
jgi:hypothetical protein